MTKVHNSLGKLNTQPSWLSDNQAFNFSSPTIDSTKVRIPLSKVEILDPRLGNHLVLVDVDTGQTVDEVFKSNSLAINENGIKTKYVLERQITSNQTVEEYLTFLIQSKLLKERYFDGINHNTIKLVYDALMTHNVVRFSFKDFMDSAELTDTDVTVDGTCSKPVLEIVRTLECNAIPRKKAAEAMSCYKKKDNLGIGFALRKTKSFRKAPYLKFYEKVRELEYNSKEFFTTYIKGSVKLPVELLRIETTIKNRKHYKLLGLANNTMRTVLDNLKSVSLAAFQAAFSVHVNQNIVYVGRLQQMAKLNINDRILIQYLITLCDGEYTFETAVEYVIDTLCNGKRERYNMKKRIQKLLDVHGIDSPEESPKFHHFNEFLKNVKTYT